ncbi:GntR family transcriptional regulator, partial [Thioclava sp. BHET1]
MGEADGVRARFDKMYHEIRMGICLLDFPPGTKLSEEALARDFGVSRTPLR